MPNTDEPQEAEFDSNLWKQTGLQHQALWQAQKPSLMKRFDQEDRAVGSGWDYVSDIPRGAAAGLEGFSKSLGGLANHVSDFFGGGELFDKDMLDNHYVKTKTWTGGLSEGITQFTLGSAVVAPLGAAAGLGRLASLGKWGKFGAHAIQNATTDFIAFDGTNERFANLLSEHVGGVFDNPVTRFLSAKPDDNWATARLKNSLEGLGLGWASELVLKKLGIVKRIANEGETPALLAEAEKLQEQSEHVRMLNTQIDAVAPGNFTSEQKTVGWALWVSKAKEMGIDPDRFIKDRLIRIEGEEGYRALTGDGVLALKQGEMGSLVDESLEARQRANKDLPSGDELLAERQSLEAESAEASKIPLEKPTVSLKDGETPANSNAIPLAETGAKPEPLDLKPDNGPQVAVAEPKAATGEIPLADKSSFDPNAIPLEVPAPKPPTADEILAKGAVAFVNDTQAVMFLFKTSDFSTFAHESFHIWRRMGLTPEVEAVLAKAVGQAVGEKWSTQSEEKASRLFERFLTDGQAPSKELEPMFAKTKEWMRSIYNTLVTSDIAEPVSPEVKQAFGKMLSTNAEAAAWPRLGEGALPQKGVHHDVNYGSAETPKSGNLKETLDSAFAEGDAKLAADNANPDILRQTNVQRFLKTPAEVQSVSNEAVINAIKNGEDPIRELTWTLKGHYNRLRNELGDASVVADKITAIADEAFDKASGHFTHEQTATLAKGLFDELNASGKIPEAIARDVKATKTLFVRTVAYRISMANEAVSTHKFGNEFWSLKAAGRDSEPALVAFTDSLKRYESYRYGFDQLQTNIARGLDAFNIKVSPTAEALSAIERKLATIRDVLTNKNGSYSAEQFLASLNAANGDFTKLSGIFSGLDKFLYSGDGSKSQMRKGFDAYMQVWTNGLLSGMRTFDGNFVSNAINMFLSPAEQWVGSIMRGDRAGRQEAGMTVMNLLSQSLDFFGLSKTVGEINDAVGHSATSQTMKALKSNNPVLEAAVTKAEGNGRAFRDWLQPANPSAAQAVKVLDDVTSIPSRLLMTADELFRQWQYRARLQSEGMMKAVGKGLANDSDAFRKAVSEHVSNGFASDGRAVREDIMHYVREATMTSPLNEGFGKVLQDAAAKFPPLKLFLPFVRTPLNIATRAVQYTPGLNLLNKQMLEMLTHNSPEMRSLAMGRMAVGAMFWTSAIGLAMTGRVTGNGPSNPAERNALLATGWQPYSVIVKNEQGKDTYYSFKRLDPIGMLFGLAADYHDNAQHMSDGDANGVAQAMLLPIASNLTNRTYMQGLSEFVNVMSQPDRKMEKFLQNRAASHVPTLFADMTNDQNLRDAHTIMDAVKARIPGVREGLSPKRNVLGEPIAAPMANSPFARAMSPVSYSENVNDSVKTELANLRHGFNTPSPKFQGTDLTLYHKADGQTAHDYMQEQVSKISIGGKSIHQRLEKLISSEKYQKLPAPQSEDETTNPRVMEVNRVLSEYRQRATEKMLKEFPEIKRTLDAAKKRSLTTPVIQSVINY